MVSNAEKLKLLDLQLEKLERQVKRRKRQDECIKLLEKIANDPEAFREVTDEEWAAMLPKERDDKLVAYYCSCRLRLKQLQAEMTEQKKKRPLSQFLQQPYVEAAIKTAELVALGELLVKAVDAMGLFAHEDRGDEFGPKR